MPAITAQIAATCHESNEVRTLIMVSASRTFSSQLRHFCGDARRVRDDHNNLSKKETNLSTFDEDY
jgi:hypothetical protein